MNQMNRKICQKCNRYKKYKDCNDKWLCAERVDSFKSHVLPNYRFYELDKFMIELD